MEIAFYRFALLAVCMVLAQPAAAHPHIFAKYEVDITRKDENTYGLHFTFKVHNVVIPHPLFRDQQFVTDNLLEAIGQHPFYIFLDIDGHSLGQQNVELVRTGGTDDEPIYTFDMDVPANTDSFGFSIYDPEYYDAVSLSGADTLRVKAPKLNCSASHQEVGKTMWGINSTTHVDCGDGKHPTPHASPPKKFPFENQDMNTAPFGKQMMLP